MPYKSIREFIAKIEEEGELRRVRAEVDWYLELGHIAKINEEQGGPALLFENVKGYRTPVFGGAFTTASRLALAMEMPKTSSLPQVTREWVERTKPEKFIAPEWVKEDEAPCKENVDEGDKIDLTKFPVPHLYPLDGGRYFGTAVSIITKDPENDWINVGTYRIQLLDKQTLGTNFIPGKHSDLMLKKYAELKKPMPVAVCVGVDPIILLVSASRIPMGRSEYDYAGALRRAPVEIVKGKTVDLPIPATAEIVVEGEVDPTTFKDEGPFGEYTGYYSGLGSVKRNFIKVNCVTYRNNPVFWMTSVGRPATDQHMIQTLAYTGALWSQLEEMRIPGIKSVYLPPEAGGRFLGIISVKQMYPGHSIQVGTAAISTEMGAYGLKTVIIVDDDIDASDIPRVLWALGVRYQPYRSTEIIKRGRSTPLDPSLPMDPEARQITSRIIMDATIPYEWKQKPILIELSKDVVEKVKARWKDLFP